MKRIRFTDEQIIGILKEHEAGTPVSELCRKHGVSDASIHNHTGFSTASICDGAPSGAAIPGRWLRALELRG